MIKQNWLGLSIKAKAEFIEALLDRTESTVLSREEKKEAKKQLNEIFNWQIEYERK